MIVRPRRTARGNGLDVAQSVANGTFLTGTLDYFDQSNTERLRQQLGSDDRIAGLSPSIVDQVIASGSAAGGTQGEVRLIALPRDFPAGVWNARATERRGGLAGGRAGRCRRVE